jgi:outer membrane receptor protein involved in Fe transport
VRSSVVLFAFLTCASAQESVHFGSLGGRVTDPTGAVIAGAAVRVRQEGTNLTASVVTDREGRFRIPYLRIGSYDLRVEYPGFAVYRQGLEVAAGSAFDLPVLLALHASGTNVTVLAEAAALETARSQIAATVGRAEVDSVPLNGRNFLDLALLAPGVSPTNTGSNQLFAETSAVPGQGISVASQRNFSNSLLVDGLSANDDAAGLSGGFYSLDAVEEFQVVTSGAQAELGRALGGYVSVVTRSGGNALHGDFFGYFRNQRLNAANPLPGARLPMTQAQYGASAGGPVIRDRTFYFANFEQRLLNQTGLVTIAPAAVAAINQRLAGVGYPGEPLTTGIYPDPVHSANGLARLDHQFAPRDQFTARYSAYHVTSRNSRGAGGLSAPTAAADLADTDQTVAAGNVATLSPRTVNETRGQFTTSSLAAPPTDPLGPAVSISGVAAFGTLSGSPTARANRLYEVVDNLSHQWGRHAFRAGADFLYNDLAITFPRSARGSYSFASLASFLSGAYNNAGFTQTFGNRYVALANPNAGWYAQDEWKVSERLTLNLGVRYELQFLDTIATDTNNLAPRAGFAWTPSASRRTVVRGGFGLYYDRVPLRALANALLSSGNTTVLTAATQASVSLSPG